MRIKQISQQASEQLQVTKMVMEAFTSKFSRVSLSSEQVIELAHLVWRFPSPTSKNDQYVAEVNGELVGTISLIRENTVTDGGISFWALGKRFGFINLMTLLLCFSVLGHRVAPDEVYIDHIVSLPHMRGQGVGTALIAKAKERLGKGQRLTLYVAAANPEARRLYERLDFCIVKRKKSYVQKRLLGEEGWYFMEWQQG